MRGNDSDILTGRGLAVVIAASGSGSRMGSMLPKQFLPLAGVPILVRTVRKFMQFLPEARIIVALPEQFTVLWHQMCETWDIGSHIACEGGASRTESVSAALSHARGCDWVAVHDGVRPLFSHVLLRRTLLEAVQFGCAVPAVVPSDSFRVVDGNGSHPVDRTKLRAIQTPQVFRTGDLVRSYAALHGSEFTDDASVAESSGMKIHLCEGEKHNIKITTCEDMIAAECWLAAENEI